MKKHKEKQTAKNIIILMYYNDNIDLKTKIILNILRFSFPKSS